MATKETTRDQRSSRQVTRKAIPLLKTHIHNTAVLANTDFMAANITPADPVVLFRVMVQLDTAAVFSAMVTNAAGGAGEVTLEMNAGAQLTAGVLYVFDLLVHDDDSVNFQCDQNANIDKFIVHEVLWATQ